MKSKKIIIAIVAILVVLGGTFAGLWFFTDIFNFLKPANDVFSSQIEKALNLEGAKFSDYTEFLNEYKELSNKPVTSKINMTADLNISELDSDIQGIINKSKLTIESSADVENNKTQNKIGLYSNNSEVLTLDLVANGTKIGVGCKDLYDKYITVSMEDIVKLAAEESDLSDEEMEQILSSLSGSNINPYDLLYISEEDLKHFDDTYRDCLKTLISKDCYTTEKKVEVEVDGDDVTTTAYYLTLTGEDAYNFVNDLTKLIKDDNVIAKIITEKVNMILEASSQDKISEEDVKEMISELTDSLIEEIEDIKSETDSAIQIAVYSDKSNPVRIELNTIEDTDDLDEKETVLSIEYAKNKTIYTIYEAEKEVASIVNEYTKNSEEEKTGKFEVKSSGMSVGTLEYEIVNKENESKIDLSLNVPLAKLSADIEVSTKGNYKKEEVTFTGTMGFKYGSESAKINFDGSTKYGDVSVPDLKSSNSVEILKLSETEMQDEVIKILTKASEVLPARLKLIGINIKAEDILPSGLNTNETENVENTDNVSENVNTDL